MQDVECPMWDAAVTDTSLRCRWRCPRTHSDLGRPRPAGSRCRPQGDEVSMEPAVQGQRRSSRCPTDGSGRSPRSSPACPRVLPQHRHHPAGVGSGGEGPGVPGWPWPLRGRARPRPSPLPALPRRHPDAAPGAGPRAGAAPCPPPCPLEGASPWCPRGQVTGDRGRGGTWWQLDQPGTGGLCPGGLSGPSPARARAPRCPRGGAGVRGVGAGWGSPRTR